MPHLTALGASLAAISPQLPDESLTTAQKNELTFSVLSDENNTVARSFGLVFELTEELRPIYVNLGADLPKFNGADTFELPVPGTFVIDQQGIVRSRFVNADYKRRMEPEAVVDIVREIQGANT